MKEENKKKKNEQIGFKSRLFLYIFFSFSKMLRIFIYLKIYIY